MMAGINRAGVKLLSSSGRILLRPVESKDSGILFEWINNRELVVLNSPFRPISLAEHEKWFAGLYDRKDLVFFMIEDVASGLAVGSCQLNSIHGIHNSAELQIRIGRADFQNKGVGKEAIRLLVRFGFEELKLHRISLHVFSTNSRAIHVYQDVGFKLEGSLREAACIEGERFDILVFGLLGSDDQ